MRAVDLVLLDLDGTVIGPDGQVADEVWEAAGRARKAGVRLGVCTGRAATGVALKVARQLDESAPHIFHNGALMLGEGAEVQHCEGLGPEPLQALVRHARLHRLTLELYTAHAIFVDRVCERCAHHAEVLGQEVQERDLLKVLAQESVVRAHWIVAPEAIELACAQHPSGTEVGRASSPALPESLFASVTRAGVSKGSAALRAARLLGVAPARVMAVGDSQGDVPMLEVVGWPRVMADGDPALQERYPVVSAVRAHGAAEALRLAAGLPG
ncbi:Cof-type HAD-IIB family hydrolase [Lujinxingia litoralis]|uniref:Cof-type HAD-IIB family hydrolase n=1 Tax=Lujinxingia litoralis TaxID=2211119 RepID=A0A328C5T5_9DELT|nr:HAD family hydrolase [Lujinxingia litoralis]RAL22192.1 Cof-type HAD-IIB family hydrolase [Lujinxingia litoralis]